MKIQVRQGKGFEDSELLSSQNKAIQVEQRLLIRTDYIIITMGHSDIGIPFLWQHKKQNQPQEGGGGTGRLWLVGANYCI